MGRAAQALEGFCHIYFMSQRAGARGWGKEVYCRGHYSAYLEPTFRG